MVHWLAVDTEGFDALVLEGAHRTLRAHRVHIVEFEYNSAVGYWHPRFEEARSLTGALTSMRKIGYGAPRATCGRGKEGRKEGCAEG